MSSSSQLVWLITGTSTGLGRAFTEAILKRGHKVIATARARSFRQIQDLKEKGADILELDVTAPLDDLKEVAKKAVAIYGRIDVLINNAGYLLLGALEENTPEETYGQFNTNLFGAINVARAFLPYMRERKSGTVVWIGSLGAHVVSPGAALYCGTKAALRSISTALHQELSVISPNLRSTCIAFGYFRTDFLQPDHRSAYIPRIPDYSALTTGLDGALVVTNHNQPGDPEKGANAVIDIVTGEGLAKGKPWPVKGVVLGSDVYEGAHADAADLQRDLEIWKDLSVSTNLTS